MNYQMDALEVDTNIRELITPANTFENSYLSDDELSSSTGVSPIKEQLENSCIESEVHRIVHNDVSQAEPCTDAGCQVEKQYGQIEMTTAAQEFTTKSARRTKSVEASVAHRKQYGSISAYDTEISANTSSVIQQGQIRLNELLKSISSARSKDHTSVTVNLPRSRVPPKWVNLEPCKFSIRSRVADLSSVYFEEPHKPQTVISWAEANNSRPSLKFDMDGPGPCTYSPRNKPLTEANSPVYSFGRRNYYGNVKGAKSTDMRSTKLMPKSTRSNYITFAGRQLRSSSNSHLKASTLSSKQATPSDAPGFTFGHRRGLSFVGQETQVIPSPNEYSRQNADRLILRRGPSFTLQFRREGTLLWNTKESNPGPAAYSPVVLPKIKRPAYTIRGVRMGKSCLPGPSCLV